MAWKASELDAHAAWLDREMSDRMEAKELEERLQYRDPDLVEQYAEKAAFDARH